MDTRFFNSLNDRISKSLVRFPAAYGMLILLVGVLLLNTFFPKSLSDAVFSFAWQFPAIGFLVTLAMDLMRENGVFRSRGWLVEGLVLAAWLGLAVWYARHPGVGATYGMISIAVAAVVAGLVVPFWKDKDDRRICLGTRDILGDGFSTGLIAGVLVGCIWLLVVLGDDIFGGEGDVVGLMQVVIILFGLGLFGVLFLTRIPAPWPSGKGFSKFMEGAARWLFLPLLGVYLLTLYVYAIRILFEWTLPDGYVSILITVSIGLMLFVLYILGPWAREEASGKVGAILKVLPWLLIPLLVLMSVGIVRRISDYGFTVDRVYLILFNLWCYGVCLYLGLTGCRKFRWIPLSFALILLLASIGPWNVSRMVRKGLVKEVRTLVGDAELPMTVAQMNELGPDTSRTLQDKLDYLQDTYGSSVIQEFAVLPFNKGRDNYRHADIDFGDSVYGNWTWTVDVPEGFTHCADITQNYSNSKSLEVISVTDDVIRFSLSVEDVPYWFECPLDQFYGPGPITLPSVNNHAVLYIRKLSINARVLDDVEANGLKAHSRHGKLFGLLFY